MESLHLWDEIEWVTMDYYIICIDSYKLPSGNLTVCELEHGPFSSMIQIPMEYRHIMIFLKKLRLHIPQRYPQYIPVIFPQYPIIIP